MRNWGKMEKISGTAHATSEERLSLVQEQLFSDPQHQATSSQLDRICSKTWLSAEAWRLYWRRKWKEKGDGKNQEERCWT